MFLPYCISILQSQKDLRLYYGITKNLENRLIDHNLGKTGSTRKRRPLRLIFCEFYLSKKDAVRREKYLKSTQGRRMLKVLLRDTLKLINYPLTK